MQTSLVPRPDPPESGLGTRLNADLMQGKASYEWVTRQTVSYTAELGIAPKKTDF